MNATGRHERPEGRGEETRMEASEGMSGGDPAARTIAEVLGQALHLGISGVALAVLDAVACVVGDAGLIGNAPQVALVSFELLPDVFEEV